jgi:hypothetical protein
MPDPPHWRAEVVLLTSPRPCMVSGRTCYPLALRLTNALDPIGRSIVLDLTTMAALIDAGMTVLEAGLSDLEPPAQTDGDACDS